MSALPEPDAPEPDGPEPSRSASGPGRSPRSARLARLRWLARLTAGKVKEGPVPLYHAVRRGLFDALPAPWKAAIARRRYGIASRPARALALAGQAVETEGLVSVILPVFNQADMLATSVRSVLAQTYPHFELIILNDGSRDEIDPVLAAFVDDPRVRILSQPNRRLPHALTNAFRFARGEFRTWTSADNLMEPDQLELLVDHLRTHPATAMVYADYQVIGPDGAPFPHSDYRPHNRTSPESAAIRVPRSTEALNLLQDNFIGACFLYRGWIGRGLGPYSAALGIEDYDYWMRINAEFRIEHLGTDALLYRYRWHANSLSGQARSLRLFEAGQELMRHERERALDRARAWVVVDSADDTPEGVAGAASAAAGSGDKRIHLVRAGVPGAWNTEDLLRSGILRDDDGPAPTIHAIDWGPDRSAIYRLGRELDADHLFHFTPDPATAAALALFTDQVFEVPPGEDRQRLVEAFGDDLRARRRLGTTLPELPHVWRHPGRRIRVLLQTDDFDQGGLECVVLDLATSLVSHGFDCALLVLGTAGRMADQARDLGITVHTDLPREAQPYRQLLQDAGVDLVLAHHSLFGAETATERGIPFVQTLHNTYHWFYPDEIEAWRRADAATTAYVHVSANVAFFAHEKLGLTPTKSLIVANGVGHPEPAPPTEHARRDLRPQLGLDGEDFVFLNVASVYPPKSQLWIAEALHLARQSDPRIKVVLLGRTMNEGYAQKLAQAIDARGLSGALIRADFHPDPAPFYAAADAFLLPSYWEGCSLAVAEALGHGLPAVLTDVGAARAQAGDAAVYVDPPCPVEALDFGNLTEALQQPRPGFVDDLARAMVALAAETWDPARRAQIAQDARRHHDLRTVTRRYAHILAWLVQGGHPAAARPFARTDAVPPSGWEATAPGADA